MFVTNKTTGNGREIEVHFFRADKILKMMFAFVRGNNARESGTGRLFFRYDPLQMLDLLTHV